MTIEGKTLENRHIGETVIYIPRHLSRSQRNHELAEKGKILAFNEAGVMVDYGRNIMLTSAYDLVWEKCDHEYIHTNIKWRPINERSCIHCGHTLS
jgi:hypothetical protein